jgi:hypothetical protein
MQMPTDTTSFLEWAMHYRPLLELAGVILVSFLIGFLTAWTITHGKVWTRTELLRREQAIWRRRLAASRTEHRRTKGDHDRIARRLKRPREGLS